MKISPIKNALKMEIDALQAKQDKELALCKEQFFLIYRGLEPLNLLKATITEILNAPDIRKNILNYLFGLTAGYISKKVVVTEASNPIKKVIGLLLKFAIKNITPNPTDNYADSE